MGVHSFGAEFQAAHNGVAYTPAPPAMESTDPQVTVNPQLIHDVQNAEFIQFARPEPGGLLGDVFGAMESLANDVAEIGQQVQQAINPNAALPNGGVLDTSLTQAETQYTHAASVPDVGSPGSSTGFG